MLRRILVAQLLTLILDPQGTDPAELMEAFPEEFTSELDVSAGEPRSALPAQAATSGWSVASADLTDALLFLVDRHLATIEPGGRVVPAPPARPDSSAELGSDAERELAGVARDEGFGGETTPAWTADPRLDELGDLFGFEQPRLDA